MQLINKCSERIQFLLCVANGFRKYEWVIPLKDKKVITMTNAFQNMLDESRCKPNNIWLQDNDMEMYSTH